MKKGFAPFLVLVAALDLDFRLDREIVLIVLGTKNPDKKKYKTLNRVLKYKRNPALDR